MCRNIGTFHRKQCPSRLGLSLLGPKNKTSRVYSKIVYGTTSPSSVESSTGPAPGRASPPPPQQAALSFRSKCVRLKNPHQHKKVSTRMLGRRTARFPSFLVIPCRVPHGFTQDPCTGVIGLCRPRRYDIAVGLGSPVLVLAKCGGTNKYCQWCAAWARATAPQRLAPTQCHASCFSL